MAQVYSSNDMLACVASIHTHKAPMVIGKAAKRAGLTLKVYMGTLPDKIVNAMKVVTLVNLRYMQGDYRHDDKELGELETLGQWVLNKHQSMAGHPEKVFKIDRALMRAKKPPVQGSYMLAYTKVREMAAT
jgi:hypothetical protein